MSPNLPRRHRPRPAARQPDGGSADRRPIPAHHQILDDLARQVGPVPFGTDQTPLLREPAGRAGALCADASRPLVITAKNTDALIDALARARAKGKRIVVLISDLSPEARDAYVGIDNRVAGQTAAYLVGSVIGDRPAGVAVLLGDHAFRCHDDREIGFRTALRAEFPRIALVGEAMGEDNEAKTQRAVVRLLRSNPALSAIYNVAGGNNGLARALEIHDLSNDICIVGHESNAVTSPLLRNGVFNFALAARPQTLLEAAVSTALNPAAASAMLDVSVYTPFNLPSWSMESPLLDHSPRP